MYRVINVYFINLRDLQSLLVRFKYHIIIHFLKSYVLKTDNDFRR